MPIAFSLFGNNIHAPDRQLPLSVLSEIVACESTVEARIHGRTDILSVPFRIPATTYSTFSLCEILILSSSRIQF